jgi:hypothetical protein
MRRLSWRNTNEWSFKYKQNIRKMRQTIWTNGSPSNPQAFITKRKQRVKQFEGQVYLNDGDEYQIELFNPTPKHILAKIKIDNTYLSGGGIVLRPGERVFLERFLDTNNKFVFRTYEVGKEAVNLGSIDNNGYVEIQFFNEYVSSFVSGGYTTLNNIYTSGNPITYTTYTTNTLGISGTSSTNTAYFNNASLTSNTIAGPNIRSSKIETGNTERGDVSNQQFTSSNRSFNSYAFHNVAWRILPTSQKQYHKEDLSVLYCGECGSKRKKDTHKFCPHCGTKF